MGSTECRAKTHTPGAPAFQLKLWLLIAVTFHSVGGSFGCRTRAQLSVASGPLPSRLMLFTEAVHSGQCSMSLITAQTRSGVAAMSTEMLKFMTPHRLETSGRTKNLDDES